jgi:predicted nucleic acid-binding protein
MNGHHGGSTDRHKHPGLQIRFPVPDQTPNCQRIASPRHPANSIRLPHQAIIEFVAATTRPLGNEPSLLSAEDARQEAEEMLTEFDVLYPTEAVLRLALRGAAAYQLNWFDAHLWAYAEYFGLTELISEDFEHDRLYGSVRIVNHLYRDSVTCPQGHQ